MRQSPGKRRRIDKEEEKGVKGPKAVEGGEKRRHIKRLSKNIKRATILKMSLEKDQAECKYREKRK